MNDGTMNHQVNPIVVLDNYKFSGMESSQIGALRSVADYYGIPVSTSWIYGMTGSSFLLVLDEKLQQHNCTPESEIYKLAGNFGIKIDGIHTKAEGETFKKLQMDAWEKVKEKLNGGIPVYARNIDCANETSVIYGYDDTGYYVHSWHSGIYNRESDLIPWNRLGLCFCTCMDCIGEVEKGIINCSQDLISYHWATPALPKDEISTLKEALEFVLRLNEKKTYEWCGTKYIVGSLAYDYWIEAIENDTITRYRLGLVAESISNARSHATEFLKEINERISKVPNSLIIEGTRYFKEISSIYTCLATTFSYQQPREPITDPVLRHKTITLVKELKELEEKAIRVINKINNHL